MARGEHEIDLAELGESLQGFSKILACAGHFLVTGGQVNRQYGKLSVKVSTTANLEAGCIEIPVWIKDFGGEIFSGFAGASLTAVVSYIVSRRGTEEMEHLSKALEQSLNQNKDLQDRLLSTIDKLADSLAAANRQALTPIGKSCKTISPEEQFTGQISELDLMTGACKISLADSEDERINGIITAPALMMLNNAYVEAFSKRADLNFRAKAQKSRDGDIMKFFISDTVGGN